MDIRVVCVAWGTVSNATVNTLCASFGVDARFISLGYIPKSAAEELGGVSTFSVGGAAGQV